MISNLTLIKCKGAVRPHAEYPLVYKKKKVKYDAFSHLGEISKSFSKTQKSSTRSIIVHETGVNGDYLDTN